MNKDVSLHRREAIVLGIILCIFAGWGNGCSWTPKVQTQIYEGPQGAISLETVSDESFRANHPISLDPEVFARALRGIHINYRIGLLQTLIGGRDTPQRVFSEQEVEFLTPHLVTAFSQVTPEEQVTFQVTGDKSKPIKGSMSFHATDLYVSLGFPAGAFSKSSGYPKPTTPRDASGVNKPTPIFLPKEAFRSDTAPFWIRGQTEQTGLVIDYKLLAKLPSSQHRLEKTGLPLEKKGQKASPGMDQEEVSPSPPPSGSTPVITEAPERAVGEDSPDAKTLLDEMRTLKKELEVQKEEIERLKQKQTETP